MLCWTLFGRYLLKSPRKLTTVLSRGFTRDSDFLMYLLFSSLVISPGPLPFQDQQSQQAHGNQDRKDNACEEHPLDAAGRERPHFLQRGQSLVVLHHVLVIPNGGAAAGTVGD